MSPFWLILLVLVILFAGLGLISSLIGSTIDFATSSVWAFITTVAVVALVVWLIRRRRA